MGLCFSDALVLFRLSGTIDSGGGVPMRSRASALTAFTALNGFGFFFLGTWGTPRQSLSSSASQLHTL